jgi:hypothetical protein
MLLDNFKRAYRETKAELKGEAVSRGRRIKPLKEIDPDYFEKHTRSVTGADGKDVTITSYGRPKVLPARPTKLVVRMLDKEPMVFFTDGSLRHAIRHVRSTRQVRRRVKFIRGLAVHKRPAGIPVEVRA